jgi:hypothetical protein
MEDNSVFQPWLTTISRKMQTVIVTGLRGCDGLTKFDPSKHISRSIRMAALKNADTTTTYMKHDLFEELLEANKKFVADLDRYPVHFVLHMMHACEILGYKHPDQHTRDVFSAVYCSHSQLKAKSSTAASPTSHSSRTRLLFCSNHQSSSAAMSQSSSTESLARLSLPTSRKHPASMMASAAMS